MVNVYCQSTFWHLHSGNMPRNSLRRLAASPESFIKMWKTRQETADKSAKLRLPKIEAVKKIVFRSLLGIP
ncbi:hypothetical protein L596_019445 [Steinernema carpocapsae]|uniref:Uncharacterized protein n=1 Tax=Steinernema carpocapsae TaxID=34508 RepID=A0A4V6A0K9_STECR|nr:hypothetical protein L596_019445 [Steinernema carpocapsae]